MKGNGGPWNTNEGHGISLRAIESHRTLWRAKEGHGIPLRAIAHYEGHGGPWNNIEGYGGLTIFTTFKNHSDTSAKAPLVRGKLRY